MSGIDHHALARHASRQLGLVTTEQLDTIGVSRRQIQHLEQTGVLRRAAARVWALTAAPTSAHQRLLASTIAAGPSAAASHRAAAWVWGFDGIRPDGIEISVPRTRNPRMPGVKVHRVSDLLPVDVTRRGPLSITTPSRTLLDIASFVGAGSLEEALDGARRRGQVHVPFLQWRLDELRRRGRPGVASLDALLRRERTSERAESWLESAFLRIVRDAWLPPPRVQVVRVAGRRRMRLDAFYDDQRLVAEVAGHGTHSSRRERQHDAERRARLTTMGLRVVDFTYEDVTERPSYVTSALGDLLGIEPHAA